MNPLHPLFDDNCKLSQFLQMRVCILLKSLQGQSPKYKKNARFIAAGKKWTRNVFDEKKNGTLFMLDLKATIFMNVV